VSGPTCVECGAARLVLMRTNGVDGAPLRRFVKCKARQGLFVPETRACAEFWESSQMNLLTGVQGSDLLV